MDIVSNHFNPSNALLMLLASNFTYIYVYPRLKQVTRTSSQNNRDKAPPSTTEESLDRQNALLKRWIRIVTHLNWVFLQIIDI